MHPALRSAALRGSARPPAVAVSDAQTRLEARRDFVHLKLAFMRASEDVAGALGVLLQRRVRAARHEDELWCLRGALLGSLPARCERSAVHHMALHRPQDSFGDSTL